MYLIRLPRILVVTIFVTMLLATTQILPSSLPTQRSSVEIVTPHESMIVSQVIEDEFVLVDAWIVIGSGNELIIENSTLVFTQNDLAIVVQNGGALSIHDSELRATLGVAWWISAESGASLVIENSTLLGQQTGTNAGINIWCDDAIIQDCLISEFGGDNINIGDCEGVRIQNNVVSHSSWEGINFARVSDLVILENQVSNTGYCGIYGTGSEDVIISRNNISSTTYSGVCLDHTTNSVVAQNNFSETNIDAISIEYCDNIEVRMNTVFSSYGCGVLSIWSTNLQIENNVIRETVYDGINLIAHSQNISIYNNEFYNIYSCGVVTDSASDIVFYGNFMDHVHLNGFYATEDSENITLILNTLLDCANGFNFIDSRNIEVLGNWVNESTHHDITVDNCWEGIVYLNAFCTSDIDVGDAGTNLFDWDNDSIGNYWMDYEGRDDNQDKIGDTPYIVSYGYYDNYPLVNLIPIHEFRSSFNITAYFWIPVIDNTNTTTTSTIDTVGSPIETLLIFSSSIQIFCVGVLLIILKRKYAS